jgi:hypothetical protein
MGGTTGLHLDFLGYLREPDGHTRCSVIFAGLEGVEGGVGRPRRGSFILSGSISVGLIGDEGATYVLPAYEQWIATIIEMPSFSSCPPSMSGRR